MGLMHAFFQAIIEDKIEFEILIEDKIYLKINKESIDNSFEYIKKEAEKINLKNGGIKVIIFAMPWLIEIRIK